MAFATSLTSARVGEACSIIDSSICVAVMTNFPRRRACRMMDFWIGGTLSSAISTPRSPRATITPSASVQNRVDVIPGLRLLDLGHDGDRPAAQAVAQLPHVARRAHERERYQVDSGVQAELQVRQILLGERGNAHLHARQIDALVVADRASVDHFRAHRDAVAFQSAQFDGAIRQQDAVAGLHVAGEIQVTGGGSLRGADKRLGGDE